MATLTAKPESLSIIKQKVKKAYFAKRVVTGSKASNETYSYTFTGSSNNTKTQEAKKNIAGIIYKKIKPDLDKNNQTTSVDEITKALTKDSYKKPDKVTFALTKDTVRFDGLKEASLGDEVYIYIETENIPAGREIKMNFRQGGDSKVITEVGEGIFVTQEGSNAANKLFTATVGKFSEEKSVANAADFEHFAIAKIKLASSNDDDNKKYKEALDKAEGKKTQFYIAMDAEPDGQDWFEVQYEEIVDNRPNVWYYGEGNWLEFGSVKAYKKGDKGADLGEILQEINIRLAGFGGNVPDEDFTERTEKTVKQFQKDYMKIEPTGVVDYKTLEAIDEFGEKYDFTFSEIKCKCGTCSGFGSEREIDEYQNTAIKERYRKYEYPGIHRSLLWAYKASTFYVARDKEHNYITKHIESGYRCHDHSIYKKTGTTNHCGKALDIHYNFLDTKNRANQLSDMNKVRTEFFIKYLGAGQDWNSGKDKFYLESWASSWVHVDIREFSQKYLFKKFFTNNKAGLNKKKLVELNN